MPPRACMTGTSLGRSCIYAPLKRPAPSTQPTRRRDCTTSASSCRVRAQSTTTQSPTVLLFDEVDRADDEFEAPLLEVLSTYQVSVPELGTVRSPIPPIVVLTSNRTRHGWLARGRGGGGLADRSHRPRSCPHQRLRRSRR